jgi:hypothetical protein
VTESVYGRDRPFVSPTTNTLDNIGDGYAQPTHRTLVLEGDRFVSGLVGALHFINAPYKIGDRLHSEIKHPPTVPILPLTQRFNLPASAHNQDLPASARNQDLPLSILIFSSHPQPDQLISVYLASNQSED